MRQPLHRIEIVKKLLYFGLLLGKVRLQFQKCGVPKPAVEHFGIGKFPFFKFLCVLLGMNIVAIADGLADILSLDHILFVELDDQIGTVRGLHFNLLNGLDLNRGLGQLFESTQDVRYMLLIVFGHVCEVVKEPILDDQQPLIGEYT